MIGLSAEASKSLITKIFFCCLLAYPIIMNALVNVLQTLHCTFQPHMQIIASLVLTNDFSS